ncbi:early activation antigen CD69-like [Mytilus californianus]|uniref:early activation antigen CD69-like n=1 Tax=Mytilus californianus TaxID=6549 RepID=UPI0022469402|nr:early activation antigen CD69-like [Mytilus californianus]
MGTNVNSVFSGGIYESSQQTDQEHLYAQLHRNTFRNAMEGWTFRCILITTISVVIIGFAAAVYYGTNNLSSEKVCNMPGTIKGGCPAGLTTEQELILNYDGNCYFFSNTALSYSQANNSCAQNNGFLAVIRDNATQIALAKHANQVSDIAESSSYWIGIKRENSTFTSTSLGKSAEFLNFDQNSLSNAQTGQNGCARLDLTEDSQWIADNCARVFWDIGHICQYIGTNSAAYTKAGSGFIISLLAVFLILQ